jgi:hypothetical protein
VHVSGIIIPENRRGSVHKPAPRVLYQFPMTGTIQDLESARKYCLELVPFLNRTGPN